MSNQRARDGLEAWVANELALNDGLNDLPNRIGTIQENERLKKENHSIKTAKEWGEDQYRKQLKAAKERIRELERGNPPTWAGTPAGGGRVWDRVPEGATIGDTLIHNGSGWVQLGNMNRPHEAPISAAEFAKRHNEKARKAREEWEAERANVASGILRTNKKEPGWKQPTNEKGSMKTTLYGIGLGAFVGHYWQHLAAFAGMAGTAALVATEQVSEWAGEAPILAFGVASIALGYCWGKVRPTIRRVFGLAKAPGRD